MPTSPQIAGRLEGKKAEDRCWRSEVGGQKSEVRKQEMGGGKIGNRKEGRAEVRDQRSEVRNKNIGKRKGRRQKTDVGRQTSEVRDQSATKIGR